MWGSGHSVEIRSQRGGSGHNVGIRSQCGGIISHFYRIKEQVSCFLVLLSGHDIGLDEVLIETICSTPKGHLVCYTIEIQEEYKIIQ